MSSLQDVLTEHRIPFVVGGEHRHVREGWIGIDCPWCGGESEKWHLGVHPQSLSASCWRCGRKSLGEALAIIFHLPTPQIWGILKALPRGPRIVSKGALQEGVLGFPRGLGPLSKLHREALRGRGPDPGELERIWGLKGLGMEGGKLAWRIWIPVHLGGEVVSWTTRAVGSLKPKYVNAGPEQEIFPIKSLLYGWDYVRHSVMICEGPSDVWRIGPGAVGVFGLNVSSSQIQMLSEVPRRIVCFDNEPIAQKTAKKLCRELEKYPGSTMNVCLDSSDPGCATDREVKKLRKLIE